MLSNGRRGRRHASPDSSGTEVNAIQNAVNVSIIMFTTIVVVMLATLVPLPGVTQEHIVIGYTVVGMIGLGYRFYYYAQLSSLAFFWG